MFVQLKRSQLVRRVVTPAALVSTLSACSKWVPVELGPNLPEQVRVSTHSVPVPTAGMCPPRHETFRVDNPRLVADRLYFDGGEVRAVRVSSICRVEQRVHDEAATVTGVLLGFGALSGLIAFGIAMGNMCFLDCD